MKKKRSDLAEALQQARLDAHLTQERLAELLHINQRTEISWETGERVPAVGMVFLLWLVCAHSPAASTEISPLELLIPYLQGDLEREKKFHPGAAFQELVAEGHQKLQQIKASLPRPTP